jgi:uncharacterized membrane protein
VRWAAELGESGPAEPSANSRDLVEAVRRQLLERDWDLGIGLTNLPLRAGRRPVSAHANATHHVGLVSIPALGAVRRERRLKEAVARVVDGLLGEAVSGPAAAGGGARNARMAARLRELGSPIGRAKVRDDGTIRFVGAVLRGNLRLLVGMVRANEPSRIITRLSRALVAALGTGAFALATADVWVLATGMGWPRLIALALASVVVTCLALVLAHGLWERAHDPVARERVVLFNLATVATVALGVLALWGALFAGSAIGGVGLIPPGIFEDQLGRSVGVGEYLKLFVLIATLATIGGALGSMIESDLAVRDAAYTSQPDSRTEERG